MSLRQKLVCLEKGDGMDRWDGQSNLSPRF